MTKVIDLTKKINESEEKKEEAVVEEKVDFDAVIKANADKKAREAAERLKKNKQTLKEYRITPKK